MAKALAKGSRITGTQRSTLSTQYAKRYAAGESIRKIAEDAGRSFGFVHGVLKEAGVQLRGRGGATRGAKKTSSSPGKKAAVAPATKKAPATKAAAKKAPAKTAAKKTTTAKKTVAKAPAKTAAKKSTAKTTTAKKTVAKAPAKTTAKKTAAKTTAKAPAKTAAKKTTAKKASAAKKAPARKR